MTQLRISRACATAVVALLMGTVGALVVFVLGLFYALARNKTVHIPGVLDYVSSSAVMSVSPAGGIGFTALVLAVLSLPLAWGVTTRRRPRS